MKNSILLTLLMLFAFLSKVHGQTIITGKISNNSVVTVVATAHAQKNVLSYTLSDTLGRYKLTINNSNLKLIDISVKGFSIEEQTITIENKSQTVNFNVMEKSLQLEPVYVSAKKITMRKDTINYSVATYLDHKDKVISDVIKKLPGVQVFADGQIQYKGKWVKDLYVEGLNMMNQRYGVVVNNISAKDVASVQVLENHQGIKALENMEFSTTPTINLKLKEASRGAWVANIFGELGGSPFARNIDANIMVFSKTMQNLSYIKSNNIGNDLGLELNQSENNGQNSINIVLPPAPSNLSKSIYYLNNSNAATINQMHKLGKDAQISYNISYMNDKEKRNNSSVSNYFINNDSTLTINEINSSQTKLQSFSSTVNYKRNSDKTYIQNEASFELKYYDGDALTNNDTDIITQDFTKKSIGATNTFTLTKNTGKGVYNFSSYLSYSNTPLSLNFKDNTNNNTIQEFNSSSFYTRNDVSAFSRTIPHFRFNLDFIFNLSHDNIKTNLNATQSKTSQLRYSALASPYILFFKGKTQLMLSCPIGIEFHNYIQENELRYEKPLFSASPKFNGQIKLGDNFELNAMYTYKQSFLSIEDILSNGYFVNYRTFFYNPLDIFIGKHKTHTANMAFAFKNIFKMLFGSIDFTYLARESDVMQNSTFVNKIVNKSFFDNSKTSSTIQFSEFLSKGFYTWNSKISQKIILGKDNSKNAVNNDIFHNNNYYIVANLDANCSPIQWLTLSTTNEMKTLINYVNQQKKEDNYYQIRNNLACSIKISDKVSINTDFNHYWNNSNYSKPNKFFLNAGCEYNLKNSTISLNCINILGTESYNTIRNVGINRFEYIYQLRDRTILLGYRIRFRL